MYSQSLEPADPTVFLVIKSNLLLVQFVEHIFKYSSSDFVPTFQTTSFPYFPPAAHLLQVICYSSDNSYQMNVVSDILISHTFWLLF